MKRYHELSEALNKPLIESIDINIKNDKSYPYNIGKNYLIRTVTMIQLGKLKNVFDKELELENASWIADTGKFSDALKEGIEKSDISEIEMFPSEKTVIIGRGSIIDACEYNMDLPKETK